MMSKIGIRSKPEGKLCSRTGFTPLENATDGVGGEYQVDCCSSKLPSSITIRGRGSLTGFTLIEIMVSVVVLAIGIIAIFEAFLMSLDITGFFNSRLNAQSFIHEKFFQIQELLDLPQGAFAPSSDSGTVTIASKQFNWQMNLVLTDVQQELYTVNIVMSWQEGNKSQRIQRATFVKRNFRNPSL